MVVERCKIDDSILNMVNGRWELKDARQKDEILNVATIL